MPKGNKEAYKQFGKDAANVGKNVKTFLGNRKNYNAELEKAMREGFGK